MEIRAGTGSPGLIELEWIAIQNARRWKGMMGKEYKDKIICKKIFNVSYNRK
jgi:hypothetical protein